MDNEYLKEPLEGLLTNGLLAEGHLSASEINQELNFTSQKLPLVQRQRLLWPRIAAAASIILCLAFSGYLYYTSNCQHNKPDKTWSMPSLQAVIQRY